MIDLDKISEGIHYELIPNEEAEIDQAWNIRILEGDFTETVIQFGAVMYNGEQDCINFNYKLISSPDEDLKEANESLQQFVGAILTDIIENGIAKGTLATQKAKLLGKK
jgi:hypothetical protein